MAKTSLKKRLPFLLLLLAFLLILLGGCAESSGSSAGMIIPPANQASPLGGKWTVLQELDESGNGNGTARQWVGRDVQFAGNVLAFDGQVWDDLSFKIKLVNAGDYLMSKYVPPSGISVPDNQEADVITVYAAGNYLGEFMKLDDTSMIFFVQNKDLLLKKTSDQTDSTLGAAKANRGNLNQSNEGSSGILLGLRIKEGNSYTYQTLWIAAAHNQMHPILASKKLFFPRTSGFWELNVQNITAAGKTGNTLTAHNLAAKTPEIKKAETGKDVQAAAEPAARIIDYISNNYVGIEKQTAGMSQLQVLPVDKLSSPTEIKISDLLGDDGLASYLSARSHAVDALSDQGITTVDGDDSGEDFGLVRQNGHWLLEGRINYQTGGTFKQSDFDLKLVPPASLVAYDTLVLSWYNIRNRVPDALDAFTSPNRDIALVETKNKLTVYAIGAEQLSENPLAELNLPEGTTVIMAEWATGAYYVESWEKSFLADGAKAVSGNLLQEP